MEAIKGAGHDFYSGCQAFSSVFETSNFFFHTFFVNQQKNFKKKRKRKKKSQEIKKER